MINKVPVQLYYGFLIAFVADLPLASAATNLHDADNGTARFKLRRVELLIAAIASSARVVGHSNLACSGLLVPSSTGKA